MSAANDEGITALHNAICAGHVSVAEYLVNYGCDVNAPDNDGWLVHLYFKLAYLLNTIPSYTFIPMGWEYNSSQR